jgi:chromosome segregation ATPase
MPTQEERLSALEKFQSIAAAHIRETEENTTILLGVIREQGRDIKRIFQRLEVIDERLGTIDGRLDTLENHMEALEGRMGRLEGRMGALEGRIGALESRMGTVENKLDQILLLLAPPSTRPNQATE